MKTITHKSLLLSACVLMATAVNAHDPSKHMAKKEKPNCEALQGRQATTGDKNDLVLQAMLKKCHLDMPSMEASSAVEDKAEPPHADAETHGHH